MSSHIPPRHMQVAKAEVAITKSLVAKLATKSFASRSKAKVKRKVVAVPLWNAPKTGAEDSALLFLLRHKPAPARVVMHRPCGKWECAYPGYPRKSFSWTMRGMRATQLAVLEYLWEVHTECTMEEPPWSSAELSAAIPKAAAEK